VAITGAEMKPRRGERPATDIPRTCARWRALLRAEMRSDALYCSNRSRQEAWLAQQMPTVTDRRCQQCGNAVRVNVRGCPLMPALAGMCPPPHGSAQATEKDAEIPGQRGLQPG
jgi:hypothetical protein